MPSLCRHARTDANLPVRVSGAVPGAVAEPVVAVLAALVVDVEEDELPEEPHAAGPRQASTITSAPIYRQQGATVDRAVVVTGGWQTSKESAYVEASRARHGTDWYIAREDLGTQEEDTHRITRLAELMRQTRAQTPSLTYHELPDPTRPDLLGPSIPESPGHDLGHTR